MSSQDVEVSRDPEQNRYELHVDGRLAGRAEYLLSNGLITFTHTEVDPAIQERGLGSLLAKAALDTVAAEEGTRVVAQCPFIAAYIARHPQYQPLLTR